MLAVHLVIGVYVHVFWASHLLMYSKNSSYVRDVRIVQFYVCMYVRMCVCMSQMFNVSHGQLKYVLMWVNIEPFSQQNNVKTQFCILYELVRAFPPSYLLY